MASLKDLIKAVQQDLPVTMRMERWLIANANANYSKKALEFERAFGAGEVGGNRINRKPAFRASGMGKCARQRVFARIGTQGISEQYSSEQANIFHTGNSLHMKWQKAGLTDGWLARAEVPLYSARYDLGGTADGFLWDGSLFEFKSINSRGYKWVSQNKTPNDDHKAQVGAYKLLEPTLTAASIVYENKDSGEWREFRVAFDDQLMESVQSELEGLHKSIVERVLPPIKPKCLMEEGMEYRRCPFRDTCLSVKGWPK